MSKATTKDMLEFAKELAQKAGEAILKCKEEKLKISFKAKNDLVTNADLSSEKVIVKGIKSSFPTHQILTEEMSVSAEEAMKTIKIKEGFIWVIDPLDGTMNFAHGLNLYSVSIGLFEIRSIKSSANYDYLTGELILGVVYAPEFGEMFWAGKGLGAFMGIEKENYKGKKIKVSKTSKLADALAVTGFAVREPKEENLPHFHLMLKEAQGVRRLGSAALDLCYTAAGKFDAFWEFRLKPWDVAAGAIIVEEAGGLVTDTNGNTLDLFGGDILATNKNLQSEILKKFSTL